MDALGYYEKEDDGTNTGSSAIHVITYMLRSVACDPSSKASSFFSIVSHAFAFLPQTGREFC
jgi:hypothetical protein